MALSSSHTSTTCPRGTSALLYRTPDTFKPFREAFRSGRAKSVSGVDAASTPDLSAAVVYYGTSPSRDSIPKIQVPVLGLYGGNDARVNATIGWADTTMRNLHKTYTYSIFDGAGHGFLRAQDQPANLEAAKQAWPQTLAFLRQYLK